MKGSNNKQMGKNKNSCNHINITAINSQLQMKALQAVGGNSMDPKYCLSCSWQQEQAVKATYKMLWQWEWHARRVGVSYQCFACIYAITAILK